MTIRFLDIAQSSEILNASSNRFVCQISFDFWFCTLDTSGYLADHSYSLTWANKVAGVHYMMTKSVVLSTPIRSR